MLFFHSHKSFADGFFSFSPYFSIKLYLLNFIRNKIKIKINGWCFFFSVFRCIFAIFWLISLYFSVFFSIFQLFSAFSLIHNYFFAFFVDSFVAFIVWWSVIHFFQRFCQQFQRKFIVLSHIIITIFF